MLSVSSQTLPTGVSCLPSAAWRGLHVVFQRGGHEGLIHDSSHSTSICDFQRAEVLERDVPAAAATVKVCVSGRGVTVCLCVGVQVTATTSRPLPAAASATTATAAALHHHQPLQALDSSQKHFDQSVYTPRVGLRTKTYCDILSDVCQKRIACPLLHLYRTLVQVR